MIIVIVLTPVAISEGIARDPGVRGGEADAGEPLRGLTTPELTLFTEGKDAFEEPNFVQNPPPTGDAGLGPRFNSDSCESCHAQPAVGGTSPAVNPQIAVATRNGARNIVPWFLSQNGPVREVRFIRKPDGTPDGGVHGLFVITGRDDAQGCNIAQENFGNPGNPNLSFRIPTPVFGLGLVEAIPDANLVRNLTNTAGPRAQLGIGGRLNRSDATGTVTRFGWKAQNPSLAFFSGEAYNVEQGVTNLLFPNEREEAQGCVFNPAPEDTIDLLNGGFDDLVLFSSFMRFLAPPERGRITNSVTEGSNLFVNIGCRLCHTPQLQTGNTGLPVLRNKTVPLYSDLAIHHMGPGLADNISQGAAGGDEFRTAPLWGLGKRIFFLHDGRTSDLVAAIQAHASSGNGQYRSSEANAVIQRFNSLSQSQKQDLLNFLRSL